VVTCRAPDRGPADPIVIAQNLNLAGPIALYAGVLYVATDTALAGHATSPVLAIDTSNGAVQGIGTQVGSAYDVAVDASGIFWTQPGELKSAPLGGGTLTSLLQGSLPLRLGLDANDVYFTTDANDTANPNRIARIPKNGGKAEVIASAVRTAGIAVAANGVYFADRNNATNEGIISFVPSAGGPSTVLATQQGFPSLLANDARQVYWLDEWPPDVKALDGMGGAPTTLYAASAGASTPKGIYLDATDVYFTDDITGNVMRVAKDGGPVTTLAQGPPGASGIVVDAEQVYWVIASSSDCGRVLRIHK
jgi:hypothetical protein